MSDVKDNGNGHEQSAWIRKPREEWITKRRDEAARTGDANFSQMHYARQGKITEEMVFVAERERLTPELVRDEVAVGHMIIPANINHPRSHRARFSRRG